MPHNSVGARSGPAARLLAGLALLPLLQGCVALAAVAVPAMTAAGVAEQSGRIKARKAGDEAGSTAGEPDAAASLANASPTTETSAASEPTASAAADPGTEPTLELVKDFPAPTGPGKLPAPSSPTAPVAGGWADFVSYALDHAQGAAPGKDTSSAILTPESAVQLAPQRAPCSATLPAVLVDLDPGEAVFDPATDIDAADGLADDLASLRDAGVLVMWISRLDANRIGDVASALVDSGLDPGGKDPILLPLGDGDRKQAMRRQAAVRACVVAIAGDRRDDFDELFDYLRDPNQAASFDSMIGDGWFLLPDPLVAPGS